MFPSVYLGNCPDLAKQSGQTILQYTWADTGVADNIYVNMRGNPRLKIPSGYTDSCGPVTFTASPPFGPGSFPPGTIKIKYTVTDNIGVQDHCE